MNSRLLRLYHRMPPVARSAAATMRGMYLRSWRYGRDTDALVEEALDRERWSEDRWRAWRDERLAFVLHRAATRVPYYREQWAERRRLGDRASWELLESWPVLEKERLRASPEAFLADDCDSRRMFHEHTSGTTGSSLDLWWSRATVRAWYALFEARWHRWYGVSRHDRWAILGGQLVVPTSRRVPPFWVWNPALNQLYMSSYHLSPDLVPHYLEAMLRYRIRYIFGYTSALHSLAQCAIERAPEAVRALRLEVAITNAEPVLPYQRETIERAFGCPVRETYGMAEIVAAASECGAGRLHLWPDVGHIEVLTENGVAAAGDVGDLVCTGLVNADMPLIRYRVGDRGALDPERTTCSCGRALPRLARLEGRADDVLYTRDGRAVGRMDPVFKSQLPVREAQIIQRALDRVEVRVVPAPGFSPADANLIIERVRDRMGDVVVDVEQVEAIPRGANGKLRAVISELSDAEMKSVRAVQERPV